MAPLKSLLLVSSGLASGLVNTCSNDNCEAGDQTALLQSHLTRKNELSLTSTGAAFFPKLGNLNDPHTRKSALLEIQKTAVKLASMDRSEVTDVVVEVCTDTANMLNETVLFAIIEEDAVDRASLVTAYDAFEQHDEQREAAEAAIATAQENLNQAAIALTTCREIETETCVNVTTCGIIEAPVCLECERCNDCAIEDSLCWLDHEIHQSWCVGEYTDSNLRLANDEHGLAWRVETESLFQRYSAEMERCHTVCANCEDDTEWCTTVVTTYVDRAAICSTKHQLWRDSACQFHSTATGDLELYQAGFLATLGAYNDIVARVMIEEADRKVEWEVLTRVICLLLTLTNPDDGAASSSENAALIDSCYTNDVDTSHLDIEYRPAPDMLDLPVLPPLPCGNDVVEDPIYGPPAVCAALITQHNTAATATCPCPDAEAISTPSLELGHYLMINPSVSVSVQDTLSQWTATMSDGTIHQGSISPIHIGAMPALTSGFFTDEEVADTDTANGGANGGIASAAWAYRQRELGSSAASGSMSLEARFALNGGMLYMDSAGTVIAVRELQSASSSLGQDVSAYMAFEPAKDVDTPTYETACPSPQEVVDGWHLYLGATHYCWTQNSAVSGDGWSCANGCFVYKMASTNKAFPLIVGGDEQD